MSASRKGRKRRVPASSNEDEGNTRPVFTNKDGTAMGFYLGGQPRGVSENLVPFSEEKIDELRGQIEANGGTVVRRVSEAKVMIVNSRAVKEYRSHYKFEDWPFVEGPKWVSKSIKERVCEHEMPPRRAMGGRPGPTGMRRAFTSEEDEFLAVYIAKRIPEKEAGGRMGNGIYKELEDMGRKDEVRYALVAHHTWHSWRERYARHQESFDKRINEIVKQRGETSTKALYSRDRRRGVPFQIQQVGQKSGSQEESGSQESSSQDESDDDGRQVKRARRGEESGGQEDEAQKDEAQEGEAQDDPEEDSYEEFPGFEGVSFAGQQQHDQPEAGPSRSQRVPTVSQSSPADLSDPVDEPVNANASTNASQPKARLITHPHVSLLESSQMTMLDPTPVAQRQKKTPPSTPRTYRSKTAERRAVQNARSGNTSRGSPLSSPLAPQLRSSSRPSVRQSIPPIEALRNTEGLSDASDEEPVLVDELFEDESFPEYVQDGSTEAEDEEDDRAGIVSIQPGRDTSVNEVEELVTPPRPRTTRRLRDATESDIVGSRSIRAVSE